LTFFQNEKARQLFTRWRRFLTAVTAVIVGALVLAPAPASAVSGRLLEPFSPIDETGTGVQFYAPRSVAVDNVSGNVFMVEGYTARGEAYVHIFGASGGTPASLTSPYRLGPFTFQGSGAIAIDNYPASPSQGTLYVAEGGTLSKFTRNPGTEQYEQVGKLIAAPAFGFIAGLAMGPTGDVFVTDVGRSTIVKFSPGGTQLARYNVQKTLTATAGSPGALAVDSTGDLFVVVESGGVFEFPADNTGEINASVFTQVISDGVKGITVDQTTDSLYASFDDHVAQYDAGIHQKEAIFGINALRGNSSAPRAIAVNPITNRIYVGDWAPSSDEERDAIAVFGPSVILPGLALGPATEIGATKATLHATVNPDGLAVSECSFEYGETTAYGSSAPCEGAIPTDSADHAISAVLSGLKTDTIYHFRVRAANANGPNYTFDEAFTTNAPATTTEATAISGTKATLNGIVLPMGSPVTECKFEYGPTTSYGSSVACKEAIPTDQEEHPVSADLTHLIPNGSSYHFRLVILGGSGEVQGKDKAFATKDAVITTAATDLAPDGATLNGTLNPEGIPYTACAFEYGPTTAYGSTVPCAQTPAQIGTGEAPVPVSADISGLSPGTTYHFRLAGTNADGTAKGKDQSLATLGAPKIPASWAEEVGLKEATLKAQVNAEGLPTTYRFEWGTDASYGNSSGELPAGTAASLKTVSFLLEGLEPGTTYHWRVVATNEIGSAESDEHTIATFEVPVPETDCPNEHLRTGASAQLPDCRAYEMVSPLDKNGGDVRASPPISDYYLGSFTQSSLGGQRITYTSGTAFGDAVSAPFASQYLSSRGADGWTTHGISPRRGTAVFEGKGELPVGYWDVQTLFEGFTPDLCGAWVKDVSVEPLTADGLVGYVNLYRRSNCGETADTYEALTNQGPFGPASEYLNGNAWAGGGAGPGLRFQGASEDMRHQVFISNAALTPDAVPGTNLQLYDLHDGKLELLSVLPDGNPNPGSSYAGTSGSMVHTRESAVEHAVSADGSRVFWTARSGAAADGVGPLFVRIDGEVTVPVSKEAEELSGKNAARFWTAAEDGSAVLLTAENTGSSSVANDLYEFDVEEALADGPEATRLIAHQVVGVLGASDDLSRIYFVSTEDLAEGAVPGEWNLYLEEGGSSALVATLSDGDAEAHIVGVSPVDRQPIKRAGRISPDGGHIAFQALGALTGDRNVDPETGKRYAEVYRYAAETQELVCVSCNPSGVRPSGLPLAFSNPFDTPFTSEPSFNARLGQAATLPTCERDLHCSRVLSDDGNRLYFHSYEALVLSDTNGVKDVYQWEAPGAGSCEETDSNYFAQNGGCLSLISTGTSRQPSEFYDASADGRDVFFSTTSGIDPRDEGLIDVYDARAGGGFALPAEPAACEGEACQLTPSPPNDATPASSSFQGAGNAVEKGRAPRRCPKGRRKAKVRGKVRCLPRNPRATKHRRANAKRRAAR
jgi:hypothetical protein